MNADAPENFTGLPCDRPDCRLEENGPRVTTLLGWKKIYDKSGQRVDAGDPNWHVSPFYCLTCNKRWERRTRGDEVQWTIQADKTVPRQLPVTRDRQRFW